MRRAAHGLVLIWVLWSTTSLDNDPRLLVSGWLFGVQPFPRRLPVWPRAIRARPLARPCWNAT